MSLRVRLAVAAAVAVAIATTLSSGVIYLVDRSQVAHKVDRSLEKHAVGLQVRGRSRLLAFRFKQPTFGGIVGIAQVVTAQGTVVRAPFTQTSLKPDARASAVAAGMRGSFFESVQTDVGTLRVLTVPLGRGYALQVARPVGDLSAGVHELLVLLLFVNLGGIALAIVLGLVVARTALSPLTRLTRAVETLTATGDLDTHVPAGRGELGVLSARFSELLSMLRASRAAQRQLVADASHELRTPLTSLRMNLETLLDEPHLSNPDRGRLLRDLTTQIDELATLVGDLVEVARDSEPEQTVTDVRLDQLVERMVESARRSAPGTTISTAVEPTTVRGVPKRLERAVANLLDNAAKWNPQREPIEVTVCNGELTVRDHGPGIAPNDLPHVFDRFYRAPNARSTPGSGLGLAIVRNIAETHGGTASAETKPDGGTLFRLSLPLSESRHTPKPGIGQSGPI